MTKSNEVRTRESEFVYDRLAKIFPDMLTPSEKIAGKEAACERLQKEAEQLQSRGEDDAAASKHARECSCELGWMKWLRNHALDEIDTAVFRAFRKKSKGIEEVLDEATKIATENFFKSLKELLSTDELAKLIGPESCVK